MELAKANSPDRIELPKSLQDTPTPFIILAHEMEHLIQIEMTGSGFARSLVNIVRELFDPSRILYRAVVYGGPAAMAYHYLLPN